MDEFSITDGVSVKLDKRIPCCSRDGGGSTDAAAMLIGVNRLFTGTDKETAYGKRCADRGGCTILYYER